MIRRIPVRTRFLAAFGTLFFLLLVLGGLQWAQWQVVSETAGLVDQGAGLRVGFWGVWLLLLVGCAAGAFLLAPGILNPLRKAVKAAEALSRNDFTQPVTDAGQDELGQLIRAMGQLQAHFREEVGQLIRASEGLATTSDDLAAVTGESTSKLQQNNDELSQSANAVNQLTQAIQEVASNAVHTSEATNEATERATEGVSKVNQTTATIEKLNQNVETTGREIGTLADEVSNITSVLDVIRGVTEQTNLLALNAAIEAARAGESGRGFAVVADEVRSLAQRTQKSTTEIEGMIQRIQSSSENAVGAMSSSTEQADAALVVAREAGDSLQEISRLVSEINDRNANIASAAEEQAQVAREVDDGLSNMRDANTQQIKATQSGEDVGEGAQLSAKARRIQQIAAASRRLGELSDELHRIVGHFTV